ncbi:hypothetical protein SAY87_014405 [Trapa incisa]|uniref:Reticulon-like protein n=1 Tax=Trapa incisa TaxID=236973 RepID=A0AAN7JKC0_9MYRT|nr:hypothetical protein SAY87_014405 [Trapa incisa]
MGDPDPRRRVSVHHALGDGFVADLLLWKRWGGGVIVLTAATSLWFLFEVAGYNVISFASNVFLLLVFILFLWAKSATLLGRPLPPLPDFEISEESVSKLAEVVQKGANSVLSIAHEITIGQNLRVFLQVACGLWIVSSIGSLVNCLTLAYIGVLLALSVPYLYDRYQDHINPKLCIANNMIQKQCKNINILLKKMPLSSNKEKKTQ